MDSNRQLQVQRLHRRIHEYRPTEEELQELLRTHAELKTAIEMKFQGSRINSQYRFPLKGQHESDVLEGHPTICDLHKQNSIHQERMVCSSIDHHISPEYSLQGRTCKKTLRYAMAQTPTNFVSRTTMQKKLRTEASDFSLNKQNLEPDSEMNVALLKRQLARTKPGKVMNLGKENKEKLSQTMKRQPSKNGRKKQRRHLNILLNDSAQNVLSLPRKIQPQTTKAATRLEPTYDFNQSYQFQGLANLAAESTGKLIDRREQVKTRTNSRKQQFPSQKLYNEQQMKLLTNRMSREGRSIKNNYRLGAQQDRKYLCTNR